jgi:hypothetical protein
MLIGSFVSAAILWFLITLFTRSTNSSQTLTETWIVVIGMAMVSIVTRLLLGGILGIFTLVLNVVALYLLVDKVCGASRAATIRICVWYFVLTFLINLFFILMASPAG